MYSRDKKSEVSYVFLFPFFFFFTELPQNNVYVRASSPVSLSCVLLTSKKQSIIIYRSPICFGWWVREMCEIDMSTSKKAHVRLSIENSYYWFFFLLFPFHFSKSLKNSIDLFTKETLRSWRLPIHSSYSTNQNVRNRIMIIRYDKRVQLICNMISWT